MWQATKSCIIKLNNSFKGCLMCFIANNTHLVHLTSTRSCNRGIHLQITPQKCNHIFAQVCHLWLNLEWQTIVNSLIMYTLRLISHSVQQHQISETICSFLTPCIKRNNVRFHFRREKPIIPSDDSFLFNTSQSLWQHRPAGFAFPHLEKRERDRKGP